MPTKTAKPKAQRPAIQTDLKEKTAPPRQPPQEQLHGPGEKPELPVPPPPTAVPTSGGQSSPDILAVISLLGAVRHTILAFGDALEDLDTGTLASLGPAIKASEQTAQLRDQLYKQISDQKEDLESLKAKVESALHKVLLEDAHAQVPTMMKHELEKLVPAMVHSELTKQVPADLKQQCFAHQARLDKTNIELHNFEARRLNSVLPPNSLDLRLEPLLPAQPQSTTDVSTTPITAFPPTLGALLNLKPEELERLIHEHGIGDDIRQPNGTPQGKKPITRTDDSYERNLNYFMAHIGVPHSAIVTAQGAKHKGKPRVLIVDTRNTF